MLYDPRVELDEAGKILYAIADYIEEHGWCQGMAQNAAGNVCLSGALVEVTQQTLYYNFGTSVYNAIYRLEKVTDSAKYLHSYVTWNDQTGRTMKEVVSACRAAAFLKE